MPRKRVTTHLAVQTAAAAIAGKLGPRLTPIPVDDWVLRGHRSIVADLQEHEDALDDLSPAAMADLLERVERTLAERLGVQAWTSVADGLPDPGAEVLCWHRDDGPMVLEYAPEDDGRRWFTRDCECVDSAAVAAWRSLPPAPAIGSPRG